MEYILNRLNESSTWRGIILVLTSILGILGATKTVTSLSDPATQGAIVAAGLGIVGLINVFRKSPASPDAPK